MSTGNHTSTIAAHPAPTEVNALLALYNVRHYAEAESQVCNLLGRFPDFAFGWKLLGGILQMQGKDALPSFHKVAALLPGDPEAHYNLAVVLREQGKLNEAVASYSQALQLKPDYMEAYSNLGNLRQALGQFSEAVECHRHALRIRPETASAHNNLSTALKGLGQLDEAIASYRHAIALEPDYVMAHYNLGNALLETGQLEAAAGSYRRAVELKPNFADAHNNLGNTLNEQGKLDDAIISYSKAVALNRDFAPSYLNLLDPNTRKYVNLLDPNIRKRVQSPNEFHALSLIWMDETTAGEKGLLRRGSKSTTYGPHYLDRKQWTECTALPDIHYHVFNKARVSINSSSVILDDKQIIMERAASSSQENFSYESGTILRHGMKAAVVRFGQFQNIKKGIFLGGNGTHNYYHWMVEILPKLEFLPALPERYQKYPLLVCDEVVRTPSLKETLDLFAKNHELVFLNRQMSYVVDELIYITTPSSVPFNLRGNQKGKPSHCVISDPSIGYVRRIALQSVTATSSESDYPKRIFFGRKSRKRNYNEDEIFGYLSKSGFTKIFLEDISFQEQVKAINHADIIVGPTGAAWTNLIFFHPGAKGLCWMAQESGDFSAFSTIAGIVGVDLRFVTYSSPVNQTRELHSKDYQIDFSLIERALFVLGVT
jgi:tetratricopeptide (TPR) repeat protein